MLKRTLPLCIIAAVGVATLDGLTQPDVRSADAPRLGFTAASFASHRAAEASFGSGISTDAISRVHRMLTRRPHIAGTDGGREIATSVEQALREAGLETELAEYSAYLSLPREIRVELTAPRRERLSVDEPPMPSDPDTSHPELGPGFVAYSASGDVTAPVVYVNYGLPPDYARLTAAGVDVRGKIVLARYARSHRAVKVHTAQQAGTAGILIYSDPADDGYAKGDIWPDGPWRPGDLLQRGNAKYSWFWHGDPLTPGVAATPGAKALDPATAPTLPRIPAAVLSSREAEKILRAIGGPQAPPGFQGGLPITYHAGPGPAAVRLMVTMDASRRPVRNVIGRIRGRADPERLVLLGTHHDAWTFGGIDPGGGAAVMLEVARGLGALRRSGWTPARSIVFAFWDAEEFGLIGSTEFAEHRQRELRERAVCYINTDLYMNGRFDAGGVPSLRDFLVQVARDVPDTRGTVYEGWREAEWRRQPAERRRLGPRGYEVELAALGSGADFVAFQDFLGLPALSLEFDFEGSYGTYHSNHDTRRYMERAGDPGFARGAVLARLIGVAAMRLANAEVLPFRYSHYASRIRAFLDDAAAWATDDDGAQVVALDLSALRAAADRLVLETRDAEMRLDALVARGALTADRAARVNDVLARLEQRLLDEAAPPNERWYRHVIYGWNIYSLYDGQPLPGLAEAIRLRDPAKVALEQARIAAALDRLRAGVAELRAMVR